MKTSTRVEIVWWLGVMCLAVGTFGIIGIAGKSAMDPGWISQRWRAIALVAFLVGAWIGYRLMLFSDSLREMNMALGTVPNPPAPAPPEPAKTWRDDADVMLEKVSKAFGLDVHQLVGMALSMPEVRLSTDELDQMEARIAARRALHILRVMLPEKATYAQAIALHSMLLLWLDEAIIAEDDPDFEALAQVWASFTRKMRAGLALRYGCSRCGELFSEDDVTEPDGPDRLRHTDCNWILMRRCQSRHVIQTDDGTMWTGRQHREVHCEQNELHLGPHRCGEVTWEWTTEEELRRYQANLANAQSNPDDGKERRQAR